MASVNKVIIVGNIGRDPETRAFQSGDQICNIRVATTDKWKDKQTGEAKEHTEWHSIVFNGRLAEIAAQYLRKGSQVYVEGSLRTRKWTDKDGNERYSTEIRGDSMQMLGGRQDAVGQQQSQPAAQQRPAQRPQPNAYQQAREQAKPQGAGFDDVDSDIPF